MDKKTACKKCNTELNEVADNFHFRIVSGKRYYRHLCKKCFNRYTADRRNDGLKERLKKNRDKVLKEERATGSARILTNECRKWDKKHGFMSDLERAFVESLVSEGCQYCGASGDEIRIGLDRIDNTQGHTKGNVVPCCTRCNLVRGDMPYEAWVLVVPGMRAAREQKFFGDWVPGNKRRLK